MKMPTLFALVGLLLASGCASFQQAESAPAPQTTPFDNNSFARTAYIEGYQEAYRATRRGEHVSTDFVPGPYAFARELGRRAGMADARARAAESSSEEKPGREPASRSNARQ